MCFENNNSDKIQVLGNKINEIFIHNGIKSWLN
jgi:hypothetical protein